MPFQWYGCEERPSRLALVRSITYCANKIDVYLYYTFVISLLADTMLLSILCSVCFYCGRRNQNLIVSCIPVLYIEVEVITSQTSNDSYLKSANGRVIAIKTDIQSFEMLRQEWAASGSVS